MLLGVVLVLAAISEIFVIGAIWSFASPFGAFWPLSAVIGSHGAAGLAVSPADRGN